MEKTAVEFYHSKIKSIMGWWTPMMIQIFEETFEQAKAIEKQQIIKAANFLPHDEQNNIKTSEEYYNETYNK